MKEALARHLSELDALSPKELVEERLARYRKLGAVARSERRLKARDRLWAIDVGELMRSRLRNERVDKFGQRSAPYRQC